MTYLAFCKFFPEEYPELNLLSGLESAIYCTFNAFYPVRYTYSSTVQYAVLPIYHIPGTRYQSDKKYKGNFYDKKYKGN